MPVRSCSRFPSFVPAFVALGAVALGLLPVWGGVRAQVRPVYSQGVAGLLQQIQRLQTTASALHTAAHPDDEDTAFIARVARGDHARVAYLSLNRGEGGQNVIGPELFEALGVIRTEELLQARALDGGEQFFTRTYDFGFSKRVDEAAAKWGEEEVLADMVRVIRLYRPLVIYNGFSGTPSDGHGHHQLAGRLTPVAFLAAADPARFPHQLSAGLRPWRARKLYVRQGFRPDPANPPTLRLATGALDPLIGRTYFEIAMEGRSQHKSQQMGVPELRGPQASALRLVEGAGQASSSGSETSVFDGLDTSLAGLPLLAGLPAGAYDARMSAVQSSVTRILEEFDALAPTESVPRLAAGLEAVRAARVSLQSGPGTPDAKAEADFLLAVKERQFEDALVRASGIVVDPLSDAEIVAPGESIGVALRVFNVAPAFVRVRDVAVQAPKGWGVARGELQEASDPRPFARFRSEPADLLETYRVQVPPDAAPTQPYWLERPRRGDLFEWPAADYAGLPFQPALLGARVDATIGGQPVSIERPVRFRLIDQVRGELRRRVDVVPALALGFDSSLEIVPLDTRGQPRRLAVRLQSGAARSLSGTLRLSVPEGWTCEPAEASFSLARKGDRTAVAFAVTPAKSVASGAHVVKAQATVDGRPFGLGMRTIAYPHIQTHRLYQAAEVQVRVLDLKVAPVRVGYVMGSGDQVPDAVRRMGLSVEMLDEDRLASADLSGFDVILVGIRASEARPDFVANNGRLLSYVSGGGTLIVQYQQSDYVSRGLAPFPAEMSSRVTDEHAPVKVLLPAHAAFTAPNGITEADWDGWVQERNLYAFTGFDARYTPMLETADPGEPGQRGGQVVARLGKGLYIYTAYAWFRQLPAGVPGAYRLFANLLSLPRTLAGSNHSRPRP